MLKIHNVTPWYVCIFGKKRRNGVAAPGSCHNKSPDSTGALSGKKRLFTRPVISVSVRGCNEKMEPFPHVRPQTGFDGKMRAV